jgi:hypothetical protein
MNYYINRHLDYLAKGDNEFETCQHSIKQLVKRAGITATSIPIVQPMGYGQFTSFKSDVLNNVSNRRADTAETLHSVMLQAKGTFRSRIFECFSPRYWIDLVVFLPKHFVEFLGLNGETLPTKLLQAVWWILAPIAIVFRDKLDGWILNFVNQIH